MAWRYTRNKTKQKSNALSNTKYCVNKLKREKNRERGKIGGQ